MVFKQDKKDKECRAKWQAEVGYCCWSLLCRYPAKSLISNVAVYINQHNGAPGIFYHASFRVADPCGIEIMHRPGQYKPGYRSSTAADQLGLNPCMDWYVRISFR